MKKFFQNSTWFGLAVGIYAIGIFVSGFLLLRLNEELKTVGVSYENSNLLMYFVLAELLLGLMVMVGFYVQRQRKHCAAHPAGDLFQLEHQP